MTRINGYQAELARDGYGVYVLPHEQQREDHQAKGLDQQRRGELHLRRSAENDYRFDRRGRCLAKIRIC